MLFAKDSGRQRLLLLCSVVFFAYGLTMNAFTICSGSCKEVLPGDWWFLGSLILAGGTTLWIAKADKKPASKYSGIGIGFILTLTYAISFAITHTSGTAY